MTACAFYFPALRFSPLAASQSHLTSSKAITSRRRCLAGQRSANIINCRIDVLDALGCTSEYLEYVVCNPLGEARRD